MELWTHPGRYDPVAGTLHTYLTVLARHRAVDLVRSDLRRVARQERSYRLTPAPPATGAGDVVLVAETAGLVRAAVRQLPASQRQVLELNQAGRPPARCWSSGPLSCGLMRTTSGRRPDGPRPSQTPLRCA